MDEDIKALHSQAKNQLEQWDLEKAEDTLTKILELDPNFADAYNKLGVIQARRKNYDQAEGYFNQTLQLDREHAMAYSNLGNIYQQRGWTDRAISAYERSIQLDPEYPLAYHNLGVLYKKNDRVGEGIELLKKAAKLERGKLRREVKDSPQKSKAATLIWIVIAIIIGIIVFTR